MTTSGSTSMSTSLVLTVIADDKPGIVEMLSAVIAENSGNWLESRMAQMAGKFAGILRVTIAASNADALIAQLADLKQQGISVRAETMTANNEASANREMTLNVVGNDRPGIVREVSHALAQLRVNVLELSTECEPAEMSAVPLFRSIALLSVPSQVDEEQLSDALEALSDDLMVEFS